MAESLTGAQGLPNRWCRKNGAIYYRVPAPQVPLWGKSWYRLGKTYEEAMDAFSAKLAEIAGREDFNGKDDRQESSLVSRSIVSSGPVIYFLLHCHRVVYVGQSINFGKRLACHATDKEFDSVATVPCDAQELDALEIAYIKKFNPKYNLVHAKERRKSVEERRWREEAQA